MKWTEGYDLYVNDDGYKNSKVISPEGIPSIHANNVAVGRMSSVAVMGKEAGDKVLEYETEGKTYSAGAVNGENTMFEKFAHSPLNRVAVHHALHQAGASGKKIALVTGLPVKKYFRAGSRQENPTNQAFIEGKIDNLREEVQCSTRDPITVMQQRVIAQDLAAWFDWIIDVDDKGNPIEDKEKSAKTVALVDIGGRTTDFAVIQDRSIQLSGSGSINAGMLDVREYLKAAIQDSFELEDVPSDKRIEQAMVNGQFKAFGESHDVSGLLSTAENEVVEKIRAATQRKIGSGQEVDHVIFIGGGAEALNKKGLLDDWYKHQTVPKDAIFANARGMRKFAMFVTK